MQDVPAYVLTPRLVLSLRELYARDLRGRCGSDIDTAFGLTSSIIFAEGRQNVVEEPGEERDDEQAEGSEEGQRQRQDAEQDEWIQTVDRAVSADAGGSA